MEQINVSILGIGSVRCAIPVIASLACYYGERPLGLRLYDADRERLDLFDRFTRAALFAAGSTHEVISTESADEALDGTDKVILQVGTNCAGHEAKLGGHRVEDCSSERISSSLERLLASFDSNAEVLSLQKRDVRVPLAHYYRLDWPGEVDVPYRISLPHRVLRLIRGEDQFYEVLDEYERSPLKDWMDDATSAIVVSEV